MPEEPLSTTVPETVTIDLGVNKESVTSLNSAFDDFWQQEDTKSDTPPPRKEQAPPPEAPGEGAAQETREISAEPDSTEPVDIDKLEMLPRTRPELVEQFKKIKDLWKIDARKAEEASKKLATVEQELAEARKNAWTPETRADYEHAAEIRRRYDFMSDPEFQRKFHAPVKSQFYKILEEAVDVLPDRQAAAKWVEDIKAKNYNADQVNRDWWLNSVVAKVPNELDRTTLLNSVSRLLDLQKERDAEITRRTNDKASFDNWVTEKTQLTAQRVNQEIMTEIGEQEKRIKEVLPVDTSQAKTTEERAAMEAHNERFEKLQQFFTTTMRDLSENGPRAWVRAAVEATRSQIMDQQIVNLEREVKDLKSERDRYKSELDKITGARRRIAHAAATAASVSSDAKKNGQGLSVKDLSDPRKALQNYWEEIDRQ